MANDPDMFRRFLARENGSGLASQIDERGGNRLVNQVTDSYAQAGQVVPDNLQGAMRELNDLTQREGELANAGAGALAYLGADGYDPLAVRRRANELTNYIYQNSAEARNLKDKLDVDAARQKIQQAELQNEFDRRTMDDRVAGVGLHRRVNEISVAQAEIASQDAVEQRAMLDHVNTNNITMDQMRAALDDGSSNAMTSTFGSTNRLAAMQLYKLMVDTETSVGKSEYDAAANAVTQDAQRFEMDGYTLEQAQQMLAGDIPIPDGYTRAGIQQAKENLTSTTAARHELSVMEAQGITDQQQMEQLYVTAMTGDQLETLANQIAALPKRPADGLIDMALPNGTPVKISIDSVMNEYQKRQTLATQRAAMKVNDNYQFQLFSRQAEESNKQVQLAVKMSGVVVPQALQSQMNMAMQAAQGKFQMSLAEPDPAKRAALQQEANTVLSNTMTLVTDYLKGQGVPEYITEDLANGKFMSNQSYRTSLTNALGFGAGGMLDSPLGGVVATTLNAGNKRWFTGGKFTKQDFADFMTPDKDGNYRPVEDLGIKMDVFDGAMTNYFVNVQAQSYLDQIIGNEEMMKLMPDQTRTALMQLATGRDANGAQVEGLAAMPPGDRIKRMMDVLQASDSLAKNLQAAGDARYADYQGGYFMRQMQRYMQDTGAIQRALNAPDGIPDRETAAVLSLWLSYRGGYDVSGANAVPYGDLVQTTARMVAGMTGANMAGRINDTSDGVNPNGVNSAAWNAVVAAQLDNRLNPGLETHIDMNTAMPLMRAGAAVAMINRLSSEPNANPMFWSLGQITTGMPLTDKWNQIADPETVLDNTAALLGIDRDTLIKRLGTPANN